MRKHSESKHGKTPGCFFHCVLGERQETIVRKVTRLGLVGISLGIMLSSCQTKHSLDSLSSATSQPQPEIHYQTYTFPNSTIHTVLIPHNIGFVVTPAVESQLSGMTTFIEKFQPIVAINGGFFDPNNQKTTSYVILNGDLVADPRTNEGLVNNPKLVPYMDKILNRAEFRRYQCNLQTRYDIVLHSEPIPQGCQLIDALGAGPMLLPEDTSFEEGFVDYANNQVIRDALGSKRPNARSAVGITPEGKIILAMAAQKAEDPTNSGVSLPDLASFLKTLGVEKAMNLDGGSSSSIYYQGNTNYGKVDLEGNLVQRPVKSVLMVLSEN